MFSLIFLELLCSFWKWFVLGKTKVTLKSKEEIAMQEYQDLYDEEGNFIESEYDKLTSDTKCTKKSTNFIVELLKMSLIIILLCGIFFSLFVNAEIPSESMEPTINVGDRILGFRWFKDITRGDIVIFHSPDNGKLFIKRVIGLPGDHISIDRGFVKINGEVIDEPWLPVDVVGQTFYDGDKDIGEVPNNCYFVLGDNRTNSHDSRYFSTTWVERKVIVAKAVCRYFPFNKMCTFTKEG